MKNLIVLLIALFTISCSTDIDDLTIKDYNSISKLSKDSSNYRLVIDHNYERGVDIDDSEVVVVFDDKELNNYYNFGVALYTAVISFVVGAIIGVIISVVV